jgi:hypothetical protein
MKAAIKIISAVVLVLLLQAHASYSGYSGAAGSKGTCATSCHGSTSGGTITVTGFPSQYTPGATYSVLVKHTSGSTISNFNCSVRKGTSTAGAGTFAAGTNASVYTVSGYETGVRASVNNIDSVRFSWTAPAAATGPVTLYLSGQQGSKSGSCTKLVLTSAEKVTSADGPVGNPEAFALLQNYPNPFNPGTLIEYRVAGTGSPNGEKVNITVTDLLGTEVATLVDGRKTAGTYRVYFNAEHLSAGVYFSTLRSGNFVQTKKLILVK